MLLLNFLPLLGAWLPRVAESARSLRAQRLRDQGASRESPVWLACGKEGEEISVPDDSVVSNIKYGFDGKWVDKPFGDILGAAGPVSEAPLVCGATVFGSDPYPGVTKQCFCELTPKKQAPPKPAVRKYENWTRCAPEGKLCQCSAHSEIRFGYGKRWVVTQAGEVQGPVMCDVNSLKMPDPVYNTRKECWCKPDDIKKPSAKVAIVSVTKDPVDLELWLRYHFNYVGIEHLYLQIEETSWLSKYVESLPDHLKKRITFWAGPKAASQDQGQRPQHDYESLQSRQMDAMEKAKLLAQQAKYDWLLHIDDDELIYVPEHQNLGDVLQEIPMQFSQVVVPNVEAVYPNDGKHCFNSSFEANTNVHTYAGYFNGKPVVRLSDANTYPLGPHRWQNYQGSQPLTYELGQQQPFGPRAMVVHYESCPFQRWEKKFWRLSNTSPDKIKTIPFPFYRESINLMIHCQSFFTKVGFKPDPNEPPECREDNLHHVWARFKTRENPVFKPWDMLPINIPWNKI